MKLTLTPNRVKLLQFAEAEKIVLNDDGEAILTMPNGRMRKVTIEMDRLEYFNLVHVTLRSRTYRLTDYGTKMVSEATKGAVLDDRQRGEAVR